ncbi:LysR substrate-binding domain-containing protein [Pendulispora brunnea]|uniref:LysR substrate-binding domain-containing protein n=1 Tax=Pendulispora brunnea TaxID=2905690 RepID=A0ABZ2KRM3_9BACT
MFQRLNNRPDFAAVQAFATVADVGSFRAAALALSAPVSTISVQVSRLEKRLGTKLLERTTRRVTLTEEGRTYFKQIRSALDTMTEAEQLIAGRKHEARGRLRIAAPTELGRAMLGRVLAGYTRQYPDVDLEIELTDERLDPRRDGVDVVIQTDPASSPLLAARKLGSPMKYRLVASPEYLARYGRPSDPRDLSKHRCLAMGVRRTPTVWRLAKAKTFPTIVHRHHTANSWQLVCDLAIAGHGIARLPEYLSIVAMADGSLEEILEAFCPPPEQLFAVYARSRPVPLRITGFLDALKLFFDAWPGCAVRGQGSSRRS